MPLVRFRGDVTFDPSTGEVRSPAGMSRLEPQPSALLTLLLERAGELVTHDDIRRLIWDASTHVNFQQGVHYAVRQVRVAIGDQDRMSPVLCNVPRRGYRLRADAIVAAEPVVASITSTPAASQRRWILWTAAAASLFLAGFLIEQQPNNHHQIAVTALRTLHGLVF